jgi:hypothetical protein
LYLKGVDGKAPSRVNPSKNHSSIDRVYGLDFDPTQPVAAAKAPIQPSPASSMTKGKKIISNTVKPTNNLLSGGYGQELEGNGGVQIKPYSKPSRPDIGSQA